MIVLCTFILLMYFMYFHGVVYGRHICECFQAFLYDVMHILGISMFPTIMDGNHLKAGPEMCVCVNGVSSLAPFLYVFRVLWPDACFVLAEDWYWLPKCCRGPMCVCVCVRFQIPSKYVVGSLRCVCVFFRSNIVFVK